MKRWLIIGCCLLLLGAILNVAVAWWCAVQSPLRPLPDRARLPSEEHADRWRRYAPEGVKEELLFVDAKKVEGVSVQLITAGGSNVIRISDEWPRVTEWRPPYTYDLGLFIETGWPQGMRAAG